MAHFAKIETGGQVSQVIVVANSDCGGGDFPESEPIGQAFISSLGIECLWLQTSYNNNFRNLYGSGKVFDALLGEYGEFVVPTELPVE